jgi:hypothetical protein
MAQGLILLGLLAALFAFLTARVRRRMGMPVSGKIFLAAITGFVLVVLALWAGSHR